MKKREDLNLYEKKITLGRDASGKVVRRSIYAKTKAELEKKVFDARQEWLQKAPTVEGERITLVTYCRKWVATEKAGSGINTLKIYNYYLAAVEKFFADTLLQDLTQDDLRDFLAVYQDKPNSFKKLRQFLTAILAGAEEQGLIINGKLKPKRIPLPTIKHVSKKRALTETEKQALFAADLTDRERSFILMLYFTGLRKEEALALTPSTIDLKNKTVTVEQVRVEDMHNVPHIIPHAKNITSLRTVPLPDRYIDLCGDYIRSRSGLIWGQEQSSNDPITDAMFKTMWDNIRKKLSVICPSCTELTAHMFRHNYATMLYYSNISIKMAARLLGHTDTNMIMKVYAHLDEKKENVADKLNRIFSGD